MFLHTCTACAKRQLIFPSQITAVADSDHGPLATFTCWCGAEQTAPLDLVPRKAAESPDESADHHEAQLVA